MIVSQVKAILGRELWRHLRYGYVPVRPIFGLGEVAGQMPSWTRSTPKTVTRRDGSLAYIEGTAPDPYGHIAPAATNYALNNLGTWGIWKNANTQIDYNSVIGPDGTTSAALITIIASGNSPGAMAGQSFWPTWRFDIALQKVILGGTSIG